MILFYSFLIVSNILGITLHLKQRGQNYGAYTIMMLCCIASNSFGIYTELAKPKDPKPGDVVPVCEEYRTIFMQKKLNGYSYEEPVSHCKSWRTMIKQERGFKEMK